MAGMNTDFLEKEAQGCRELAAQATQKKDREYWLRLAQRWESLLQRNDGTKLETVQAFRPKRSALEKRFARRSAA